MEVTNESIQSLADAIIILARAVDSKSTDLLAPTDKTPSLLSNSELAESGYIAKASTQFTKELADMLTFSLRGNIVYVKPKRFLGSDCFAKIGAVVRQTGGQYISAGKDSHFEIPTSKL